MMIHLCENIILHHQMTLPKVYPANFKFFGLLRHYCHNIQHAKKGNKKLKSLKKSPLPSKWTEKFSWACCFCKVLGNIMLALNIKIQKTLMILSWDIRKNLQKHPTSISDTQDCFKNRALSLLKPMVP